MIIYKKKIIIDVFDFGFQEAGPEGGKIQLHFEELLKNNTAVYVVSCLTLTLRGVKGIFVFMV